MKKNFLENLFSPRKIKGGENSSSSLPILYPAPEFRGLENWINTPPIASMQQLMGKVVLIDFWTYSCINCLNALPYVKVWHKKYKTMGWLFLVYTRRSSVLKRNTKMFYKRFENIEFNSRWHKTTDFDCGGPIKTATGQRCI